MNKAVVYSAFIQKGDKYLLVFDPKFKFWRVPGGRPRGDENAESVLKRELKEELDLKVDEIEYVGDGEDEVRIYGQSYDWTKRKISYYKCKAKNEPKILETYEASEIKWLSLDEIKNHENLEPAMKEFFERNPVI